jgi:hypothetical protein
LGINAGHCAETKPLLKVVGRRKLLGNQKRAGAVVDDTHREVGVMPREAKLFLSSSGSAARAFLRFRANIPPRWIRNAQKSRKRIEPEIVEALRSVRNILRNRPRAQVALKNANKQFKTVLRSWETAYNKENFYRGIRILLELQRNGSSKL